MGSRDRLVGVGSFPLHRHSQSRGFAKGHCLSGYSAFSAPEAADPGGRGVPFHEDRFPDEKGFELRELLTNIHPKPSNCFQRRIHRTKESRFRRYSANTSFLGFG